MRRTVFYLYCMFILLASSSVLLAADAAQDAALTEPALLQGMIAGEVTETTAILHARLTGATVDTDGDVPGCRGAGQFELATDRGFTQPVRTDWLTAEPAYDYILKTRVSHLRPGTRYYWRLLYGLDRERLVPSRIYTFRTLPGADKPEKVSFAVVTGMNYGRFRESDQCQGENARLGIPGYAAILKTRPDFFIATGDDVYYDSPKTDIATSQPAMRAKWHKQFTQPRLADLFAATPTYWEKDDHDYRRDDSDPSGDYEPSHELGIAVFREQVPVTDPADPDAVTYRTIRLNKLVQVWLPEGRDYRSPNRMPDGPGKSIWGVKQREWLKRTLLTSDATFKILIMETPMVGPDRSSKRDNHTNPQGFRYEGEAFFTWLKDNGFLQKNFYLVCGDRHWQYESIHPTGFTEFSCGTIVEANAIIGDRPGEPQSTDPKGLIKQLFHPEKAYGGFLLVTVLPASQGKPATVRFDFYNDTGKILHTVEKPAVQPTASRPEPPGSQPVTSSQQGDNG